MTEPIPNLPLLRKILDHIDAHPEEHDQSDWVRETKCGTTYCVGGWAEVFTYGKPTFGAGGRSAARALGLNTDEAEDLFYSTVEPRRFGLAYDEWSDASMKRAQREAVQVVAERIAARAGEVL